LWSSFLDVILPVAVAAMDSYPPPTKPKEKDELSGLTAWGSLELPEVYAQTAEVGERITVTVRWALSGEALLERLSIGVSTPLCHLRALVASRLGRDSAFQMIMGAVTLVGPYTVAELGILDGADILVLLSGPHFALTSSADGTVRIWSAESGCCVQSFGQERSQVRTAAFSQDGELAVTTRLRLAHIWRVGTGECIQVLEGHVAPVCAAEFSPDGSMVVTTSLDWTARVWAVESGECTQTLQGHQKQVGSATFSPSGRVILTASADKTARAWDVESGECLQVFDDHHSGAVNCVAFSVCGSLAISTSSDRLAKIWLVENGSTMVTLEGHHGPVCHAAFSPNGFLVITAGGDTLAMIWISRTGEQLLTLAGHLGPVLYAAFSPDAQLVITASGDNTARVWSAENGACFQTFAGHTGSVCSAMFHPKIQKAQAKDGPEGGEQGGDTWPGWLATNEDYVPVFPVAERRGRVCGMCDGGCPLS